MPIKRKGMVIVYTGDGKGKTTAAFGMAFRAMGRRYKVAVVQFIKGKWMTGERQMAKKIDGIDLYVMGKGFTWESKDLSKDKQAAQAAWQHSQQLILAGKHPLVILDEITYAINYGFISIDEVTSCLINRPETVTVVVTGRNAPQPILDMANLVSEMKMIKHPYDQGHRAQLGIDF